MQTKKSGRTKIPGQEYQTRHERGGKRSKTDVSRQTNLGHGTRDETAFAWVECEHRGDFSVGKLLKSMPIHEIESTDSNVYSLTKPPKNCSRLRPFVDSPLDWSAKKGVFVDITYLAILFM